MTNTLKLKAAMVARGLTQADLARLLNLSEQTMNYKINNRREFKASEIQMLISVLQIPSDQVDGIFFVPDVDS